MPEDIVSLTACWQHINHLESTVAEQKKTIDLLVQNQREVNEVLKKVLSLLQKNINGAE